MNSLNIITSLYHFIISDCYVKVCLLSQPACAIKMQDASIIFIYKI